MIRLIKSFVADESGVTAMEYGMIAALIAVVILTTLGLLGGQLNTTFSNIEGAIEAANGKK